MKLTSEIIGKEGYRRINNSMWRLGNITLQNGHISDGKTILERVLSTESSYKVCVDGKYLKMITTKEQLIELKTK